MRVTENFRRQHSEILDIIKEVLLIIMGGQVSSNANKLHDLVVQLAGKLTVHLSMEDNSFYPRLLNDPRLSEMAKRYIDEMGELNEEFNKYKKNWLSILSIKNDPNGFIRETRDILESLSERIKKEDTELYPMVDDLG